MKEAKYDFSGWATKNDLLCADGRIIRKGAFKECDGMTVPLVWNHQHDSPDNVVGHALLKNLDDGVYTYCSFNNTEAGETAKNLVNHGDIVALSIYANRLKQQGNNVVHGVIREVSLVLAGANPGATIDTVIMAHSDESDEEAIIYTGEDIELTHAEMNDEEAKKQNDESDQKEDLENKKEKEEMADNKEKTVQDVIDSMTEEQKNVLYALVGQALEQGKGKTDEKDEGEDMKHNVFDNDYEDDVLTHADMEEIFTDAKRYGSLKESVLQHGITNIGYMYPDNKTLDKEPQLITRDMEWVSVVMNGVHHTPFARIKSLFADITADEARARGYITGNLKAEEVFTMLKRETSPTTIYKKQKINRDELLDITNFDTVTFIKNEMKTMLNEEAARAYLVGDGRSASSNDKINPQNIRPIWTDSDLFTVKVAIEVTDEMTDEDKTKAFIKAVIKNRKRYKGSGNPIVFMTEDLLTNCLLLEDGFGRPLYDDVSKLATKLRAKAVVSVPVMDNQTRVDGEDTLTLGAILVNLNDYNVGMDKGGEVNMFDDFDIDYNAQKYLIETRQSGALVKPYSAMTFEFKPKAEEIVEDTEEDPQT